MLDYFSQNLATAIASFLGAAGSIFAILILDIQREIRKKISGLNNIVGLAGFSFETSISLKRQFGEQLFQRYHSERSNFIIQLALRRAKLSTAPLRVAPYMIKHENLKIDPIESLIRRLDQISDSTTILNGAARELLHSARDYNDQNDIRNSIIDRLHENQKNLSDREIFNIYYGLIDLQHRGQFCDSTLKLAVEAMESRLDRVIFFSKLVADEASRLVKQHRKQLLFGFAQINTLSLQDDALSALIPDANLFATFFAAYPPAPETNGLIASMRRTVL